MSETSGLPPSDDRRRLLRDALRVIEEMRRKVEGLERSRTEPIAIIGLACRFPGGADDPDTFWQLLHNGVDAVIEVPANRWGKDAYARLDPEAAAKMPTQYGGFLKQIDQFDPHFFGIAAREAVTMDPQQRLVLEVCWEALENAGLAPDSVRGSLTGVFVGITASDYTVHIQSAGAESLDHYAATGNAHNAAAGRISYTLGLQGPSMAIDTACSSSLTAIHLACQSLRLGESNLALAGGVHVLGLPDHFVSFFKWGMIGPDGRCKTFDAAADGFVRAEGSGIVVLKRLSDAIKDGDNVLAVIRGSAVNQDGASSGLTVPNGPAQEAVIRQALRFAGVAPSEVGYVEAHGTGTSLGDPIELEALDAVLGEGRSKDRPLIVGSVKTNLGHLEAAAGVAGLMKVVLALQRSEIPPHLHFKQLNPRISLRKLAVMIPTEPTPWPSKDGRRIAGVSAFGFSGTNAHLVVEEAPVREPTPAQVDRPLHVISLTAKSEAALLALARRWERRLAADPDAHLGDVAFTANVGRAQFPHRVAVVAGSATQAREQLLAVAAGEIPVATVVGGDRPKVAFLFTGQGAQYVGMGRELYNTQPTFRAALQRCDELLGAHLERPLLSVLYPDRGADSPLDQTAYTQPALFALEYALAELWRSWGIEPAALMGHSVGEYAAACVAGVVSLEDALGLVASRGRMMQALPPGGEMVAVSAAESRVRAALGEGVSLAAVNGPESVVISGRREAVRALQGALESEGVRTERLKVSHAFHSALMDRILDALEREAAKVPFSESRVPLVSNLTGRPLGSDGVEPAYWRRHAREPVRFAAGMSALYGLGCRVFLEMGPSPTLLGMGRRCLSDDGVAWLPSLREGRSNWEQMLESLVTLHSRGTAVSWAGFDRDYSRRKVSLPTYPFQRERYWVKEARGAASSRAHDTGSRVHPLLGRRLPSALEEAQFEAALGPGRQPFLGDHRIYGTVVLPATAYLEMGLAAAAETLGPGVCVLEDVSISEPLRLPAEGERTVQVIVAPEGSGPAVLRVFSREEAFAGEPSRWRLHAVARIRRDVTGEAVREPLAEVQARCAAPFDPEGYYARLRQAGIDFGPSFRGITALWRGRGEALGRVRLPEEVASGEEGYQIHPALLDACVQVLGAAIGDRDGGTAPGIFLPVSVERVRYHAPAGVELWSHARLRNEAGSGETIVADLRLCGDDGQTVAELEGLRVVRATAEALRRATQPGVGDWLYELAWRPKPLSTQAGPDRVGSWVVFADADGVGEDLARRWAERGRRVLLVFPGTAYERSEAGSVRIDPARAEDFRRLVRELAGDEPLLGVVHLWNLGMPAGETAEALRQATAIGCGSLLHLVQALAQAKRAESPRLWVVTRGAEPVDGSLGIAGLAQAPVWGLARTIAGEHPELRCTCVDLDPTAPAGSEMLLAEVAADEIENQVAYRQGRRHVARLVRSVVPRLAAPESEPVELGIATRGILDDLRRQPVSRRAPGRGEVEIRVLAAGLNFRDVLNALGVYEGPAGPLGSECAGRIVAVGEGVEGLEVGQDVVALSAGTFRTYLTTAAALVVRKPEALSTTEAAAAPVAFLTAEYALGRLAHLGRGERVLIHAAAGGVGLAALQVAQRAGAEVFATAGSPEKRALLESLGVRHVMDSRSLVFAEEVRARTGGEGVDVVLNSLAGEFIPKSLGVLRAGGRFLEIGKAGIWKTEEVTASRPDVAYFPIYLGDVDPALLREMLRKVMDDLASGTLKPLPLRPFPLGEAAQAFRYMAQAKHIGKIVLVPEDATRSAIRGDATYLVTGGLGSLGRQVARWLVERGARHLVLAGRRGATEDARAAAAELERAGARVVIAAVDVAREDEVARLVAGIDAGMPPLRGVVHAAGVLDDGVVRQQSWERFEPVLAPKVSGAWNLHRATRSRELDFFVLFSSSASLLGSPGQGNYAAANAFLDALAHHRRGAGLPALSINWGPWGEVGMAASLDQRDQARWVRQGVRLLPPEHALAALERLLGQSSPQVGVLAIDLSKALESPSTDTGPLFAELARTVPPTKGGPAGLSRPEPELLAQLERAPAGKRPSLVRAHVRAQVRSVLGLHPSSALDPRQGFRDLGMDSLMAIELRNRLQVSVGRTLPATLAFDFPTIDVLARYLMDEVLSLTSEEAATAPVAAPAGIRAPGGSEPIAIIGLGCRFPGMANDPESFWRLLRHGVDAITEVPRERWDLDSYYDADPDAPGKMYTRHGGFIEDIDKFDPQFFGISPREAAGMDPQQRLLLEVSWGALEHAGQAPDRLMGSRTGVFVGISSADYAYLNMKGDDPTRLDAYFGTGNALSVAAGRLSFILGLQGPSLSVDTACSSSLVAVHLACQSLRNGECRLALAGGVNAILSPESTINFCRARMLAVDGRCKTFDASADGYVRGEGAGAVVLKRLSDALADGDSILAVIRGTAVNQDGRSSGLTVPNGPAQEALLREALATAGVAPAEVAYIEAHGTGTSLGDPIEMKALGAVLRVGRPADRPLVVGSVKTNVGHLEAAAGVAGLIKVVLALQHGEIPPHLHVKELNPHISLREIPAVIPDAPRPWPEGRKIAGISAFGFSGTNAHVVVEEAPVATSAAVPAGPDRPQHLLALSAKTEDALRALAGRFGERLSAEPSLALADVAFSANVGRAHFAHRLAVTAESTSQGRDLLADFVAGAAPAIGGEFVGPDRPEVAFLFTGQGSQYAGMGRRLYQTQPTFRKALDLCDELLRAHLERPLLSVLYPKEGGSSPLDETAYTQPALFALEWALYEVWKSWGIEPSAVMGHSVGEYVAACVAGVFSLEDALKLVAARGRLMQSLPSGGAMAAVLGKEERVFAAIASYGEALSIAAVNGSDSVVVSGRGSDLGRVVEALEREGFRTKPLPMSHAFHSALMDPVLEELERVAGEVSYSAPRITLVSNVTGRVANGEEVCSAGYWRRHARQAVRFGDGMAALWEQGYRLFVEVGPSPTLLGMGRRCMPDEEGVWLPSLRPARDDWSQILESLGHLYVRGAPVDWAGFDRDYPRRRVVLPTYPFERKRYWVEDREAQAAQAARARTFERAAAAGRRQARQAPLDLDLTAHPAKLRLMDRLTTAYVVSSLRQLGAYTRAGEAHTIEALRESAGILPVYRKLLSRWLSKLAAEGLLRQEGELFVSPQPLPAPALDAIWAEAATLAETPVFNAYLERCGAKLVDVLSGRESPLETLFPGGRFDVAEALYEDPPAARYVNGIAAAVAGAVAAGQAGRAKLRVLEVGAGTGGTTSALLPVMLPEHTVYVFTDVSELFLGRAREKFVAFPFVRYGLLDIGRDPAEQGYPAGSFDLVVAANVLHAAADLGQALDHARSLLAPGGLLVLSETTSHHSWMDITTGLIEGWQQFDDGLRHDSPLLPAAAWGEVLHSHRFEGVVALPEAGSPAEVLGLHVLVARAPLSGTPAARHDAALFPPETAMATRAAAEGDDAKERREQLRRRLEEALPGQAAEILLEFVRESVILVLRLDPSRPADRRHRLLDLGFDSLMAVELRNRLATGLGLARTLPATLVFDHPTIEAIADYLAGEVLGLTAAPARGPRAEAAPSSAAELSRLSEEEAEALLLQKLEGLER